MSSVPKPREQVGFNLFKKELARTILYSILLQYNLELQAKRSTFDEDTLFIPFDDVAVSLPAFEAREISWTLWKALEYVRTGFTIASDVVMT